MPECRIIDCDRPLSVKATGLCESCHVWSRKRGWADPTGRPRKRRQGEWRAFLEAAAVSTSDDCIIPDGWTEQRRRPHANIVLDGERRQMDASRAVWWLAYGDPGDLDVLHRCNGGSGINGCLNIRHLYPGDRLANARDAIASGRIARGSRVAGAKLSEDTIRDVRADAARGMTQQAIASRYGTTQSHVSNILSRLVWGWLDGDGNQRRANPQRRLTADEADAIRADVDAGSMTQREIATRHGVSQPTVSLIATGKTHRR